MKKCDNKFFTILSIILIGGVSSFLIFTIADETNEVVLVEYFDRLIMVFVVVIVAMVLSSWVTKKKK